MAQRRGAIESLLIANRGEIAIRIARTAAALGLRTVAVHSQDERDAPHARAADASIALEGEGASAYLSTDGIIAAARSSGCDAVHPGYGFLSENAGLAAACREAGLVFVGPDAALLTLFGDKARAKRHASAMGVPVLAEGDDARGPVIVKAVAGGGGRGIRVVHDLSTLAAQIEAAGAEALSAFGSDAVLVERYIVSARHIEVQLLGDASGRVAALGTRDCTLQRRHQKLLEIAPAQALDPGLADRIVAAAIRLLDGTGYVGLATAEFLVDRTLPPDHAEAFAFLEVNPRLQVEHTVTEEVFGVDLVALQLSLASGETLPASLPAPRGVAIQLRINAETIASDGAPRPSAGSISGLYTPGGPGIRIDSAAQPGYVTNPRFDPLLAKLIVHAQDWPAVLARARRAISEYRIDGVATNIALHAALLARSEVAEAEIDTAWFERNVASLAPATEQDTADQGTGQANAEVVTAPLSGVVVSIDVAVGDAVRAGAEVGTIEALKMQHAIVAPNSGIVEAVSAHVGRVIDEGSVVLRLSPSTDVGEHDSAEQVIDPDFIRPDLAEVQARHALGLDENRPDAMERRRRTNQRSARENLDDLFDAGSFVEYGALTIAAQRRRRSLDDLMRNTPADGMIGGIGTVNAHDHGEEAAKCLGLAYDYTVLAGTQGHNNHRKTDRLLGIAADLKLPIVFYTEGGGGRPGDVDSVGATGLDVPTFRSFAALSGVAPRLGITSGYSFAGNAVLFGSCDITIATRDAHIGVGGPAMIEGGGLGVFSPKEVGPVDVHWQSGAIDILAEDEADATDVARRLLSFFQGTISPGTVPDQRLLRHAVPENRLRVFDMRAVIAGLFDADSFVELRGGYARGMITGLARIDGRAVGLIANDCRYLSGAVDAEGADKAARFFQLCDAFGIPIVSLCDTPGFMVGPEAEKTAPIRRAARMFVVGAALSVPVFTVVIRKAYGLGAQAMAGGSLHAGPFTIAWPTAEFGGMGLEGAVRLGYRKELEAIAEESERQKRFEQLVAQSYERGKAVSVAQYLEIDAVIDPADTRKWLLRGLASTPSRRSGRYIDTW
ncbi:acetyl-CoA carboxylase family protein [Sphingomonas dokdonensis]|uniref:Acetyl-/propionyl-coenzyme A carboxylase alpha chain n=1 Tax=Sphingomonas dokdonensis TaxID=344880 RepID=A0A245ZVK7_9SPHN|nr:carboxyl transferase domain-containing protein [Sphingomonas dokdonensis]OWK33787.1 acetyl-/propionyl-coenzyme A carboxylase alpha chain [Sphingomonas dokdonensis]